MGLRSGHETLELSKPRDHQQSRQVGIPLGMKDPEKNLTKKSETPKEENEAWWRAIGPANSGNYKAGGPKVSSLIKGDRGSPGLVSCPLETCRIMNGRTGWLKGMPCSGGQPGRNGSKQQECSAGGPHEPSNQSWSWRSKSHPHWKQHRSLENGQALCREQRKEESKTIWENTLILAR